MTPCIHSHHYSLLFAAVHWRSILFSEPRWHSRRTLLKRNFSTVIMSPLQRHGDPTLLLRAAHAHYYTSLGEHIQTSCQLHCKAIYTYLRHLSHLIHELLLSAPPFHISLFFRFIPLHVQLLTGTLSSIFHLETIIFNNYRVSIFVFISLVWRVIFCRFNS